MDECINEYMYSRQVFNNPCIILIIKVHVSSYQLIINIYQSFLNIVHRPIITLELSSLSQLSSIIYHNLISHHHRRHQHYPLYESSSSSPLPLQISLYDDSMDQLKTPLSCVVTTAITDSVLL